MGYFVIVFVWILAYFIGFLIPSGTVLSMGMQSMLYFGLGMVAITYESGWLCYAISATCGIALVITAGTVIDVMLRRIGITSSIAKTMCDNYVIVILFLNKVEICLLLAGALRGGLSTTNDRLWHDSINYRRDNSIVLCSPQKNNGQ